MCKNTCQLCALECQGPNGTPGFIIKRTHNYWEKVKI